MKRLLVTTIFAVVIAHAAEAKRAQCTVFSRHDPSERMLAFEVDDGQYPHILSINGLDENASPPKLVDIPLFNEETAMWETWYLSRVERSADQHQSIYRMYFGEYYVSLGGVAERNAYVLYLDWKNGTAGFLDELLAFNVFDSVEKKPHLVVWPATCERLD